MAEIGLTRREPMCLTAFHRSRAGAALVVKMPTVMAKTQNLTLARIGPLMQKLKKATQDLAAEDPPQARAE